MLSGGQKELVRRKSVICKIVVTEFQVAEERRIYMPRVGKRVPMHFAIE